MVARASFVAVAVWMVVAALILPTQGQSSSKCFPYGVYTAATAQDKYTMIYYVEISEGTPSPSGGRTTAMSCHEIKSGSCPFETGTCDETEASWSEIGNLSCIFNTGLHANATIERGCYEIEDWTNKNAKIGPTNNTIFTRHQSHKDNCAHYIQSTVCTPSASGDGCDCSTPDKCVACAMQYHTGDDYFFSYDCSGRSNPLEEIRAMCNATQGRVASPIVPTKDGKVQGFKDPDSLHYIFRGIPFAAPPITTNRFRPPQPVEPWEGVRNASEYNATCIQRGPAWQTIGGLRGSMEASEDCLYLNVFTPAKYADQQVARRAAMKENNGTVDAAKAPLAPVMVYFPAGQFMWGSGNDAENFNAPQTSAGAEVVVVTANYRLGAFGYLALEDLRSRDPKGSTGNYGTLDQRAVLEWIHNNIESFGGDPANVVLWGESAGAAAVTAQLSAAGSFPLYHKAILESGAFNGWSYKTLEDAEANALSLCLHLGCLLQDNVTVNITCLEHVDSDTMISLDDDGAGMASCQYGPSGNVETNNSMPFMDTMDKSLWAPVIDGVVLTGTPVSLLREGKTANVPMMFGTNRDEGSTFTGNGSGTGDGSHTPDSWYNKWLYSQDQVNDMEKNGHGGGEYYEKFLMANESQFVTFVTDIFGDNATSALLKMYAPGTVSELGVPIKDWWWSVSQVIGDFVLSCPARRTARTLEKLGGRAPAYVFFFDHQPILSVNQPSTYLWGAFHGSEVPYVWYDTFELAAEDERELSSNMVQYWVNFAWNGDPNIPPPSQATPPTLPAWKPYSTADDAYMVLGDGKQPAVGDVVGDAKNISVVAGIKKHKCDFWDAFPTQWTDPPSV